MNRQRPSSRPASAASGSAKARARAAGQTITATADASAATSRALRLLAISALASSMSMRLADPMLPGLAGTFGGTSVDMAAVVTAFSLAYALCILVYGPLGDRRGKLRVIMMASYFAAATSIACAVAPGLPSLVSLRFLTGAACAGLIPLSLAWIGDRVSVDLRQQTLARFAAATLGGQIAGQVIGGVFADTVGWRWAFLPPAGLFLIAGIALWRSPVTFETSESLAVKANTSTATKSAAGHPLADDSPAGSAGPRARPRAGAIIASVVDDYRRMLSDAWVRVVMVMVGIEGACYFGALAFVPSYLHHHLQIALWQAGLLVAAVGLGGLLFPLFAGVLVRRLALRGCAMVGAVSTAGGLTIIVLSGSWPVAVLGCVATGFGFTMLHNSLQTQATQMWPESRGTAMAGFVVALFGGQAIGVALSARIIPILGYEKTMLALAAALAILGFAYAESLRRR